MCDCDRRFERIEKDIEEIQEWKSKLRWDTNLEEILEEEPWEALKEENKKLKEQIKALQEQVASLNIYVQRPRPKFPTVYG